MLFDFIIENGFKGIVLISIKKTGDALWKGWWHLKLGKLIHILVYTITFI